MIKVISINNEKICIQGIGKLFYQEGLPIGITIDALKQHNIGYSVLHIADELLKNGWSPKTTFAKLKVEIEDDISKNHYDLGLIEKFCFETYENQRELIFKQLFNNSIQAKNWLSSNLRKND